MKDSIIKSKIKKYILSKDQISEAFINSVFLALSGGLQDAYTYNIRDKVFSNAQTGNIVLMTQHMIEGDFNGSIRYIFPIMAFILGVLIAENIQNIFREEGKLHWRQVILLIEILILAIVGYIPEKYNMAASVLVSLSCAMQVQSFRKVEGYSYASTMCIGNLRSGTTALSVYIREKKSEQLKQALYYFGVIFFFAIGAGIGGVLSFRFGIRVIWISCALLFISFCIMCLEKLR